MFHCVFLGVCNNCIACINAELHGCVCVCFRCFFSTVILKMLSQKYACMCYDAVLCRFFRFGPRITKHRAWPLPSDCSWHMSRQVWNMQYLDGGHWDSDPQKCVFGEVYKKVVACLEESDTGTRGSSK